MRVLLPIGVLLLVMSPAGQAGIGDVDPAYGNNGRVQGKVLPLPDGRALVSRDQGFGRIDAAGRADPAFGTEGRRYWPEGFVPNWDAWLRLPDGSTLLGGARQSSAALVRIDAAGELDLAFEDGGVLTFLRSLDRSRVEDIVLSRDGMVVLLTGEYLAPYYLDSPVQAYLWRLDPSRDVPGDFDVTFRTLVGDYRTGEATLPHVENYRHEVFALWPATYLYETESAPAAPPHIRLYHRHVGAAGEPVAAPDPVPGLDSAVQHWQIIADLPGEAVLVGGMAQGPGSAHYKVCRLDTSGRMDLAFGDSGCVTLAHEDPGSARVIAHVATGGGFLYVAWIGNESARITRVLLDGAAAGTVDASFGSQGTVRFGSGVRLAAMQGTQEGALLLVMDNGALRLHAADVPHPGILSLATPAVHTRAGPYQVRVSRSAGSLGTVGVDFRTAELTGGAVHPTVPGIDYQPVNLQLTWGDGDTADKFVTIEILPEFLHGPQSTPKGFEVRLDNPSGGVLTEIVQMRIYRLQSAWVPSAPATPGSSAPPAPSATPPPQSGSGGSVPRVAGGGAVDLIMLVMLGLLTGTAAGTRHRSWANRLLRT